MIQKRLGRRQLYCVTFCQSNLNLEESVSVPVEVELEVVAQGWN